MTGSLAGLVDAARRLTPPGGPLVVAVDDSVFRRCGRWGGLAPPRVRIYGRDRAEDLAEVTCLWYGRLGTATVRVILARDTATTLALVSTDLAAPAAALIERYAARWSIGPGRGSW